jgi:hypothetical protein
LLSRSRSELNVRRERERERWMIPGWERETLGWYLDEKEIAREREREEQRGRQKLEMDVTWMGRR